jgi:hypothetical protein
VVGSYTRTNSFAGTLLIPSDISSQIGVSYTFSGTATSDGWNLIGNPYPCALSASNFISNNNNDFDAGHAAIYYWDDVDGDITNSEDYAVQNQSGATAASGNTLNTPNGLISVGQGFFVKVKSGINNLSVAATQRTTNSSSQFFITTPETMQRLWLNVNGPDSLYNEILLSFFDGATDSMDQGYDAIKLKGNANITLYSILNGYNEGFAIQSLPPVSKTTEVPLGIDVGKTGSYVFKLKTLENFNPLVDVYLKDLQTGTIINLRKDLNYQVNLTPGQYKSRFILIFQNLSTGVYESQEKVNKIEMYTSNNKVYINGKINSAYPITITDIWGRIVRTCKAESVFFAACDISGLSGVYFVTLITDQGKFTQKILCNSPRK